MRMNFCPHLLSLVVLSLAVASSTALPKPKDGDVKKGSLPCQQVAYPQHSVTQNSTYMCQEFCGFYEQDIGRGEEQTEWRFTCPDDDCIEFREHINGPTRIYGVPKDGHPVHEGSAIAFTCCLMDGSTCNGQHMGELKNVSWDSLQNSTTTTATSSTTPEPTSTPTTTPVEPSTTQEPSSTTPEPTPTPTTSQEPTTTTTKATTTQEPSSTTAEPTTTSTAPEPSTTSNRTSPEPTTSEAPSTTPEPTPSTSREPTTKTTTQEATTTPPEPTTPEPTPSTTPEPATTTTERTTPPPTTAEPTTQSPPPPPTTEEPTTSQKPGPSSHMLTCDMHLQLQQVARSSWTFNVAGDCTVN